MKIGRAGAFGAALLASLAFVAGCQGSTSPSSNGANTTTSTSATAASEELADAMRKLNSTSYSFSYTVGLTITMNGAADPANKAAKATVRVSEGGARRTIETVVMGTDYYVKMAGLPGTDGSKYMHLDATRATSLKGFGIEDPNDPTNAAKLARQLATVERSGDDRFKGTMDLTKSGRDNRVLAALGDKAKSVPFEATVDPQGRLTTLKITIPATSSTPELSMEMTYSDFGGPVSVAKPAASEVVEAPDSVYRIANG